MNITIFRFFPALIIASVLCGCTDETERAISGHTGGTIILNNGKWGDNNACIGTYDPDTKTYTPYVFLSENRQMLGDIAQDIIRNEDETYIAVNGSRTIFVTDPGLKIKKQINTVHNGTRLSPRYMTKGEGKIYVSYYEGYLGEIDPKKNHAVRITPTGRNPEGLAYSRGKIYVANSGGADYPDFDNTVSVIDAGSFTEEKKITVNTNPELVYASSNGGSIYVSSIGDYAGTPARLQKIDLSDGSVSDLDYAISKMHYSEAEDMLYILCGEYGQDWKMTGRIYCHNAGTDTAEGEFIKDGTRIPDAYSVSVTDDGYVYVGSSDYISTGDIYVFTPEGRLHDIFDTQGMNPIKAI